ncbi:MAG: hypothetical protein ACK40X_07235, partial [Armatimonadota bacterium]
VIQKPRLEIYGFGDVDNDGQVEVISLCSPNLNPVSELLRWALLNLSLIRPPLPDLLLVWKSDEGWKWKTCKIFSTPSRKQGYEINVTHFYSFMDTRIPRGVCRVGGRWWLFVSANSGITRGSCFTCRFGRVFATLRGGYSTCPHSRNEYWQETRLWSVQGDKAIEMLKLDAILAHEFTSASLEGVDLDGDGEGEAVLTRTVGNNAVFVARFRNERWEVGKVERPCKLVSISLSRNPRPCLLAVWEDGTVAQISIP